MKGKELRSSNVWSNAKSLIYFKKYLRIVNAENLVGVFFHVSVIGGIYCS